MRVCDPHRLRRAPLRRRVTLLTLAVVAVAATAATAVAAQPDSPPEWNLIFGDDFTGAAGTAIDAANWLHDTGTSYPGAAPNWGTGEIATMTRDTANVYQDGSGNLAIRPIRDSGGSWTSGRVETQRTDFQPPSGGKLRVEARLQLPNVTGAAAQGYWPAFWMLGAPFRGNYRNWPAVGEIDIMENVNGLDTVYGTLHCGVNPGGPCHETSGIAGNRACPGGACQAGFHTYRVEWDRSVSPEQLRWYLDDVQYHSVTAAQVDPATWAAATGHGFFLILNVAIGGGWPGPPGGATRSGVPMLVDYVSVHSAGAGSTPTAGAGSTPTAGAAPTPTAGAGSAATSYPSAGAGPTPGPVASVATAGPGAAPTTGAAPTPGAGPLGSPGAPAGPKAGTGPAAPPAADPGGARTAYSPIQAEGYNAQSGVGAQPTGDTGGGDNLAWIGHGDWIRYDNVDFGSTSARQFYARVASGIASGGSGLVEVHLDRRNSAPVGTFAVANTGGWQNWRVVPANMAAVTGIHTVFLTFSSGQPDDFVNLNWFSFGP